MGARGDDAGIRIGLSAVVMAVRDRQAVVLTIDGDVIRWIGVALYAAGGALRMWPVFVLGRRFSGLVAIQPGHELVTDGIYRTVRNPSYLGMLVLSLGWALAFRSLVGVLLALLMLIPLVVRIRAEEALLRSQFGAQLLNVALDREGRREHRRLLCLKDDVGGRAARACLRMIEIKQHFGLYHL